MPKFSWKCLKANKIDRRRLQPTWGLAIPGADETCVMSFSAWPVSSRATRLRRRGVCKQILCTFMAGWIGQAGRAMNTPASPSPLR